MTGTTKLHMDGISRIKCNILFIVAGILCVPANVTAQFITISESSAMTAETPNKVAVESDAERRTYQADSSYYANRRRALEEVALTDSIVRPNESDDNHILYGNDLELRAALAAYFAMTDSLMMEYVKESSQISIGYQSAMMQASVPAKKQEGKESYGLPKDELFAYTNPLDTMSLTVPNVLRAIIQANIKHPIVVLAQAIHETGWFSSVVCHRDNNLFGLTNPKTKQYYRFSHWTESVLAYRDKVQYKYKGGNYLEFLDAMGYAEDPLYVPKVKRIISHYLIKSPLPEGTSEESHKKRLILPRYN